MGLELLEYLGISIASATVLIVVAKFVLQRLIRKAPDYYDKRELAEEAVAVANYGVAGGHGHHEPEAPTEKKPAVKKPRKPSMNMKKDELIAAAKERGIKVSTKLTKAQILEKINEADK